MSICTSHNHRSKNPESGESPGGFRGSRVAKSAKSAALYLTGDTQTLWYQGETGRPGPKIPVQLFGKLTCALTQRRENTGGLLGLGWLYDFCTLNDHRLARRSTVELQVVVPGPAIRLLKLAEL